MYFSSNFFYSLQQNALPKKEQFPHRSSEGKVSDQGPMKGAAQTQLQASSLNADNGAPIPKGSVLRQAQRLPSSQLGGKNKYNSEGTTESTLKKLEAF